MNYEILKDEQQFLQFLRWLPELANDECYLLCLFARKKYAPVGSTIKDDKCQLKRVTCTKQNIGQKICQMQVEIGAYAVNGIPVPQEALALYITVNPRSHSKAAKNLLIKLAEVITKDYNGYNAQSLALSEIQRTPSRKPFFDLDIDGMKAEEVRALIAGKINLDAVSVLTTRGGIHLLVEVERIQGQFTKSWYQQLVALPGVDVRGDNLIPVPGCCQGGFVPMLRQLTD
ncbi:hypothetical protein IC235_10380 [Hymenobacter sp. BT664]|uniref:Uncharacterized protein n=1 Tax=Hymenobacter montanus TaxID=2771359 RepID=A0A927BDW3_9BACT|nr:hypothetical protein [Hymenobacter montanus]MBD2768299.1 hypothetical protein [Hymenobacter montanus]